MPPESTPRKPRNMRPKPVTALRPVSFTDDDASCYPVTGLVGRRVGEVAEKYAIPFLKLGKRKVFLVNDWEAGVARAAEAPGAGPPGADVDNDQLETAEAVLAQLGRRRVAGGSR